MAEEPPADGAPPDVAAPTPPRSAGALAIAHEQENVAKQAENRALVVLAEAEIPRAMAEAFRSGNFGVMDYYKLKNVQADTNMRDAIARPDGPK